MTQFKHIILLSLCVHSFLALGNASAVIEISSSADFFSKVCLPNSVYIINCTVDLSGKTFSLPENCSLRFFGGMIKNGILIGNSTTLDNPSHFAIFEDIDIGERAFQFINDFIYVDWFAGKSDADRTQYAVDFAQKNRNAISFLSRQYSFDHTVVLDMGQVLMRGTGSGGEYRFQGTRIVSSPFFSSRYAGQPLFYVKGEKKNEKADLGLFSGRITGISFCTNKKQDVFHFRLSRAPSRPFFVDHCSFLKCGTALRILDNGLDANLAFLYVENCTFNGNKWNVVSHGKNALMGLYFCKNVAEQCDGNINLGYSEDYSEAPYDKPKPSVTENYSGCANIVISDNLLEGTVDCIYIYGGKCIVNIERNYFESRQRQFVVLSFTNPHSMVSFNDNYIAKKDDVSLHIRNCSYSLQKSFNPHYLTTKAASPIL